MYLFMQQLFRMMLRRGKALYVWTGVHVLVHAARVDLQDLTWPVTCTSSIRNLKGSSRSCSMAAKGFHDKYSLDSGELIELAFELI
jgi:hypothetical protein